jgi:hypothetical protein
MTTHSQDGKKRSHKSDSDRKHRKHHKEHKSHKSSRHHRDREEESSSSSDDGSGDHTRITEDDYFLKMDEFRVWLKLSKNLGFDDIPAEECRNYFADEFVPAYNKRRLPDIYYNGIPPEIRNECTRTKHVWKMKITDQEKDMLASTSDEIEAATRSQREGSWRRMKSQGDGDHPSDSGHSHSHSGSGGGGGRSAEVGIYGPGSSSSEPTGSRADSRDDRGRDRAKGKQYSRQLSDYLDETAPREMSGRERQLDKRAERSFRTHAGSSRDEGLDHLGGEGELYGRSSRDELAELKAREQRHRQQRDGHRSDRAREYQSRERDSIDQFRNHLSSSSSGGGAHRPMVPPREDYHQ